MTKNFAMIWGDIVQLASRNISENSTAINCAYRPVRNIGILTIVTMMSLLVMAGSAYAQEKCSARVTAILNDPEANKPPEYSGIWDAYECSSCKGVQVDLREYKFNIKHKNGKVGIVRDLDELNYRVAESVVLIACDHVRRVGHVDVLGVRHQVEEVL